MRDTTQITYEVNFKKKGGASMAEFYVTKLLGGVANGEDAPGDWDEISEWTKPGTTEKSMYEQRSYFSGEHRYVVWVDIATSDETFLATMKWHKEMYRGDLVAAQKDLLRESMVAARSFTNAVMVAGYAALFVFWSTSREVLTPLTLFCAAIALAISVLFFIGWEMFGMILRSRLNVGIARAVNEPQRYEHLMRSVAEDRAGFMRKFYPTWLVVISVAAGCALLAFGILLSAFIHGAWLSLSH